MKIGCIGTGAMGGAIMRAVCKKYDVSQIKVTEYGIEMLLANGGKEKALTELLEENSKGTLFSAE